MTEAGTDRAWREGLILAFGAYLIWGFLPLLFKAMEGATAYLILAYRVVGTLAFVALAVTVTRRWSVVVGSACRPRLVGLLLLSTLLIATNWLTYILAVQAGHVLQASLGYFINPLVNVVIGLALLGEKLRRLQAVAVLLAGTGVIMLTLLAGTFPWIALLLALTFGFYGLVRKVADVPPLEGVMIETALLFPVAFGWLMLGARQEPAFASLPVLTEVLLLATGPITALPLLAFSAAAKRMPYSTLGLIQYVAPTVQFLLALFLFREPFSLPQAVSFGLIWAGIALYMADGLRRSQ